MPPSSTSGARYHSVTICRDRVCRRGAGGERWHVLVRCATRAPMVHATCLVRVALDRHAECAAQAKVRDLKDVASLVDEQVLRLEVSVWQAKAGISRGKRLVQPRISRPAARLCMTPWRCRCAMPMHSWYMKFCGGCGAGRRCRRRRPAQRLESGAAAPRVTHTPARASAAAGSPGRGR